MRSWCSGCRWRARDALQYDTHQDSSLCVYPTHCPLPLSLMPWKQFTRQLDDTLTVDTVSYKTPNAGTAVLNGCLVVVQERAVWVTA